ncbi:hypothetical protein RB195_017306 [Necator americanus]|uniref:Uncharacterized protein n=1 Tax=Necator americanus TaxID=51031 RepID=A0ABR1C4L6_NECAM
MWSFLWSSCLLCAAILDLGVPRKKFEPSRWRSSCTALDVTQSLLTLVQRLSL